MFKCLYVECLWFKALYVLVSTCMSMIYYISMMYLYVIDIMYRFMFMFKSYM